MKRFLLFALLLPLLVTCKSPDPAPCNTCDRFHCQVNGERFYPSGPWKSNPLNAYTKDGKRTLVIAANNGPKFMFLSLRANTQIETGTYSLNDFNPGFGHYSKTQNGVGNRYRTDSTHTGMVTITDLLIEGKRIIRGTFSFTAIDSLTREEVQVKDGFFQVFLKDY